MIENTYRTIMEKNRARDSLLRDTVEKMNAQSGKASAPHRIRKRTACAAAGMAAAVALLFGVNAAFPAFAESIPGLGSVFARINEVAVVPGANLGTYEASLKKLELPAVAAVDSGYSLTVDEAFCDGEYLYASLIFDCPEQAEEYQELALTNATEIPAGKSPAGITLTVNGKEAQVISPQFDGAAVTSGKCAIPLVAVLPERLEHGAEGYFLLKLDSLYGRYPGFGYEGAPAPETIPTGFTAAFSLTADTSRNYSGSFTAEDNGVRLESAVGTPGYVKLCLTTPDWGVEADTLLSDNRIPIGTAVLLDENGEALREISQPPQPESDHTSGRLERKFLFTAPAAQSRVVILRLLDVDRTAQDSRRESEKPGVFAEFTINLKSGEALDTKTYEQEGYQKLDSASYQPHPDFSGGYLVESVRGYNLPGNPWQDQVVLLADVEEPEVELRFYKNGELTGTAAPDPERILDRRSATDGAVKWRLEFTLTYGQETAGEEYTCGKPLCDRIELVDAASGTVLLSDLYAGDVFQP